MGKIDFDPLQKLVIKELKNSAYLSSNFYFTGGTALSICYFQHRYSEDLDFFTEKTFVAQEVMAFVDRLCKKYKLTSVFRRPEGLDILIYTLKNKNSQLKIDFNHYPFKRLESGRLVDGISVDSLRDIGTNKLITINQRTDVKDFVDLYYLLQNYTVWDLMYGVEAKFRTTLELFMIASDFMKVEDFTVLPRMIKPLRLTTLQSFFRRQAKEVGKKVVI